MVRGEERWRQYEAAFGGALAEAKAAPEPNPIQIAFLEIVNKHIADVLDCACNHTRPLISEWYGNCPEVYAAMDVVPMCPVDMILAWIPFSDEIEEMHMGLTPDDSCALIRFAVEGVKKGWVPTPDLMSVMVEPCDAQSIMHEAWQAVPEWRDVPTFALDYSYGCEEEDFAYFGAEIGRQVEWLEQNLGKKMDWDLLRQITEETNRMYSAWDEVSQCLMQKPCPLPSLLSAELGWKVTQHLGWPGDPKCTEFFQMMAGAAAHNVEAGIGACPDERIRVLWADLDGEWSANILAPWMEKTYGAVIVQSFAGATHQYKAIDCSTRESMLTGLGRRYCFEVPMIRQGRGSVDVMMQDIRQMVRDYQIDAVFFPGHRGHKDQGGNIGYLQELCRELDVPLLAFTSDIFDVTYMPIEQVQRKVSEFFEAHGWMPLDKE